MILFAASRELRDSRIAEQYRGHDLLQELIEEVLVNALTTTAGQPSKLTMVKGMRAIETSVLRYSVVMLGADQGLTKNNLANRIARVMRGLGSSNEKSGGKKYWTVSSELEQRLLGQSGGGAASQSGGTKGP